MGVFYVWIMIIATLHIMFLHKVNIENWSNEKNILFFDQIFS